MPRYQPTHNLTTSVGGPWILKSQAMKSYGLGEADLRAIQPLSVEPNARHSRMTTTKYSLDDVLRLRQALDDGVGLNLPAQHGASEIMKTYALKDYKVSSARLEATLQPSKQVPNRYRNGTGITTFYWRSEVQALAQQGENIGRIWAEEAEGEDSS